MKLNIFILALFCFMLSCTSKTKESAAEDTSTKKEQQTIGDKSSTNISTPAGVVALSELIANKETYAGQTVIVNGRCTKVNNNIMNRNWIHLKDESLKNDIDFTVTTTEDIKVGDTPTLQGTIAVDKDFGSGYKYEIIMEDAKLVK
ncbi:MAG TPA: hypothetical protein VMZ69_10340 [Saprospiraceae bacterium]|nr:hypothetical protein [Saprospiraceae bacterium]